MSASDKDTVAAAVAVEGTTCNNLLAPNPKLDNAVANSQKNNLPEISTVLEIGTLGGYSTIWLAQTGARVTSIEINPKHREVALENVAGLDTEITLGAALDVLPKLANEGRKFDMVFCDASWGEQEKYFDWAVKLTRPKGCIDVDNVVWNVLESNTSQTGKNSLLTHVGKNKRVTATLVPMVSTAHSASAGRTILDGFLLAVVN